MKNLSKTSKYAHTWDLQNGKHSEIDSVNGKIVRSEVSLILKNSELLISPWQAKVKVLDVRFEKRSRRGREKRGINKRDR